MQLVLLGDNFPSIVGHSWLVPGELGAGQISAGNGNMEGYTSGARDLTEGLKSLRESLVPIHLVLPMQLRELVEQLPAGLSRSSISPGQVGHGLCFVYRLQMAECLEPGAEEGAAFVRD